MHALGGHADRAADRGDITTQRDEGCSLRFVIGPCAHPVERRHRREDVDVSLLRQILLRQFLAAGNRGGILDQVQCLAELEAIVANTLRRREEAIQHGDRDGDARWHIGAGQKARLATVQLDAARLVFGRQPVEVLIVANAF